MHKRIFGLTVLGFMLAVNASCTELEAQNRSMPSQEDGRAFYLQNCASCHGDDGKGSGADASGLSIKPVDLTTLSAQNGGVFPASRALSFIYGDPENGHLARVMPEFGQIMSDELVPVEIDSVFTPTPRELAGLLEYLESIQE
jgi:mono/diheme cytochrome c family protein